MWVCAKMTQITSCIEKIITLFYMNTNKIFTKVEPYYEAPAVTPLDIISEGLLCQSFGDANKAGKDLNEENEWDF